MYTFFLHSSNVSFFFLMSILSYNCKISNDKDYKSNQFEKFIILKEISIWIAVIGKSFPKEVRIDNRIKCGAKKLK